MISTIAKVYGPETLFCHKGPRKVIQITLTNTCNLKWKNNSQCIAWFLRTKRYFICNIQPKYSLWTLGEVIYQNSWIYVYFHNFRVSRFLLGQFIYYLMKPFSVCAVGRDLWDSLSWRCNLPRRGRFGSKKEKVCTAPPLILFFSLL